MPNPSEVDPVSEILLFESFQQGIATVNDCLENDPEVVAQLQEALAQTQAYVATVTSEVAALFMNKAVLVTPINPDDKPITAYYYATPYPRFGNPGFRPHEPAITTRRNPRKAMGTVIGMSLTEQTMQVRPRLLSPYRWDRGYFDISMFDDSLQPKVKIEFLS